MLAANNFDIDPENEYIRSICVEEPLLFLP